MPTGCLVLIKANQIRPLGRRLENSMESFINFYPTPESLLRKITRDVQWWEVDGILDPSAGKGDIVDFVLNERSDRIIDCIEINPELRAALKGKGYSVIHDDFLTFVPKYHYDLIIMNPPFDKGDLHLLKALDIQKNGGRVICILNAETIRNPYTKQRQMLANKLGALGAKINYYTQAFSSAERTTDVEIAVVDVEIPKTMETSFILENLRKRYNKDEEEKDITDLVDKDFIAAAVARYDIEVDAGIRLIREYKAMAPYILDDLNKGNKYAEPLIRLSVGKHNELSESAYVRMVRAKYWKVLFADKRFTGPMTEKMISDYRNEIDKLASYDFSVANIKELQVQMCSHLVSGIEESIIKLFEKLSYTYSWSSELDKNIHYYNGWATNKAWYVNSKVILPARAWDSIWNRMSYKFSIASKFVDMEKAFNYLAGCPGAYIGLSNILETTEKNGITKNIECRYFTLTFYKKGTVHIVFKDLDLLKKLNIFGGKGKKMLPPRYGKVPYQDMTEKERAVVNEFDGGETEYMKVYGKRDYFIVENWTDLIEQENN